MTVSSSPTGIAAVLLIAGVLTVAACGGASRMTFFVTSVPASNGGDIGGLTGADAHCQMLADAAGAPPRQWRAYLSTAADANVPAVNARDRIGTGPFADE